QCPGLTKTGTLPGPLALPADSFQSTARPGSSSSLIMSEEVIVFSLRNRKEPERGALEPLQRGRSAATGEMRARYLHGALRGLSDSDLDCESNTSHSDR